MQGTEKKSGSSRTLAVKLPESAVVVMAHGGGGCARSRKPEMGTMQKWLFRAASGTWVFIGRTDAKAETPILWPPHVKS